ncbi:Uncharacterised protein [Moraxella caviae]|nr:Uncharacterised protein [Moraxella caviae]
MEFVAIVAAPIVTISILVSSKLIHTPRGKKIVLAAILCAVLCLLGAVTKRIFW